MTNTYANILHLGLIYIRNLGHMYPEYASIEADHLHNLPITMIDKITSESHDYYLETEVPCYLKKLERLEFDNEVKESILILQSQYKDYWAFLKDPSGI